MTANVRRRRRAIDPDYEKKRRIKKVAKNVVSAVGTVGKVAKAAVMGGQGKEAWGKAAKKVKRKKPVEGMLEKQGYMDLYEGPAKEAKKKRKFTKVDEEV